MARRDAGAGGRPPNWSMGAQDLGRLRHDDEQGPGDDRGLLPVRHAAGADRRADPSAVDHPQPGRVRRTARPWPSWARRTCARRSPAPSPGRTGCPGRRRGSTSPPSAQLTFEAPDAERFPALALARDGAERRRRRAGGDERGQRGRASPPSLTAGSAFSILPPLVAETLERMDRRRGPDAGANADRARMGDGDRRERPPRRRPSPVAICSAAAEGSRRRRTCQCSPFSPTRADLRRPVPGRASRCHRDGARARPLPGGAAFGVAIDRFSIGFGRAIVALADRSGVEWRIGWLPLGGYVMFAGDENAASVPGPGRSGRAARAHHRSARAPGAGSATSPSSRSGSARWSRRPGRRPTSCSRSRSSRSCS